VTASPSTGGGNGRWRKRVASADAIRPLRVLQIASIIVPILIFALIGLETRRQFFADAEHRVRASAVILSEHALKVLETQQLVLLEVQALIAGRSWSEIDHSRDLHLVLQRRIRDLPQISAIGIVDRDGNVVVSSDAYPPPDVNLADRDLFRLLAEQDRGPILTGPFESDRPGAAAYILASRIAMPQGLFDGAIVLQASPDYLADYFTSFISEPGQVALLAMTEGDVLARIPRPASGILAVLKSNVANVIGRRMEGEGVYISTSPVDGIERVSAAEAVGGGYPLYVIFGQSTQSIRERWYDVLGAYGAIMLIASMSLFLTTLSALRRTQDVLSLQDLLQRSNEALERGVQERTADLKAANDALQGVNATLRQTVAERELLLREIHHRVKNNLQVIISLLNLQAHAVGPSLVAPINESLRRIRTMARIHEIIYSSSDVTAIDFAVYLEQLCGELIEFYGIADRVSYRIDADFVRLDLDTATPLAMIVNEALANACKHAFPEGVEGEIEIEVKRQGNVIRIRVEDNGVGLPKDFGTSPRKSMGMRLISTLSARLEAEYRFEKPSDGRSGTVFHLSFLYDETAAAETEADVDA
jgi:two-component sensor histidine kinase